MTLLMAATLISILLLHLSPTTFTDFGVGVGGEKIPLYAGRVLVRKMAYPFD
jgi:hypothetical protein